MTVRVGINGFGRIGRNLFRAATQAGADIEFVAVNDLGSLETMAHLLKYDSVLGTLPTHQGDEERHQGRLVGADRAVRARSRCAAVGRSRRRRRDRVDRHLHLARQAAKHLEAGAPLVVVSAPSSGADATFVYGVNHKDFDPKKHQVVSNASCTTNCFVPLVKVLDDAFGVVNGLMTTVHAYTGDQSLVDGPHKDLRRARAAAINIVPTSTGAARATSLVMESMKGKLDGTALRVPVPTGSLTDFTANLRRKASVDEINAAYAAAAKKELKGVLRYSDEPLVSSDIVTDPHSCVFDSGLTMSMGKLVKVNGWYDNEWGYSNRLVDFVVYAGSKKR
jgi:glyceraldehyde 3-phosphate dehydrogenase